MRLLHYQELLHVTDPAEYEAEVLTLPHVVGSRVRRSENGSFLGCLRGATGQAAVFYRSSVQGIQDCFAIEGSADQLELHATIAYQDLIWRSPWQTLHQASLPLLVVPGEEYQISVRDLDALVVHFSYRRILTEVAIAREGVVSPTLFLAQGRPGARLQCRRILEEIAAGLEVGMTEDSLVLLERALITTVAHHWNPDERSFEASYRHVTLALDWMQLHLSQPFAWSELCRDVGVSQRCLEVSFQRELELSPNRWLKQERLRSLRQRLLAGDRCIGVPLAQLFENCGLPYCGSTQRAYNRLYGETPAHTRHRVARGPA